ncbi:MAG: hypothetical protein ACK5V1_21620, partial [Planctomycetaceae bacterium]
GPISLSRSLGAGLWEANTTFADFGSHGGPLAGVFPALAKGFAHEAFDRTRKVSPPGARASEVLETVCDGPA